MCRLIQIPDGDCEAAWLQSVRSDNTPGFAESTHGPSESTSLYIVFREFVRRDRRQFDQSEMSIHTDWMGNSKIVASIRDQEILVCLLSFLDNAQIDI